MSGEKDERREAILRAAERLFKHYGQKKTTVADIAKEAGLGVGTVYLVFQSKDEIVEALSGACHTDVLVAMRKSIEVEGQPYAERLRNCMRARLAYFLRLGREGQHGPELLHCAAPGVRAAKDAFRQAEEELVMSLLAAAHGAREFSVARPEQTARTLLRAYASLTPPWVYALEPRAAQAQLDALNELLLAGLLRR